MDPATAAETLRQVITGEDIPKIGHLLKRMSADQAALQPPGFPYSVLTNLAHAEFWHRVWLGRLEGKPRPSWSKDWRVPDPGEFVALREEFLDSLVRAHALAAAKPFVHKMKSDEAAVKTLVALAVHDAYHIGQIKLMARFVSAKDGLS